jgi:hypothetical protein
MASSSDITTIAQEQQQQQQQKYSSASIVPEIAIPVNVSSKSDEKHVRLSTPDLGNGQSLTAADAHGPLFTPRSPRIRRVKTFVGTNPFMHRTPMNHGEMTKVCFTLFSLS